MFVFKYIYHGTDESMKDEIASSVGTIKCGYFRRRFETIVKLMWE